MITRSSLLPFLLALVRWNFSQKRPFQAHPHTSCTPHCCFSPLSKGLLLNQCRNPEVDLTLVWISNIKQTLSLSLKKKKAFLPQ